MRLLQLQVFLGGGVGPEGRGWRGHAPTGAGRGPLSLPEGHGSGPWACARQAVSSWIQEGRDSDGTRRGGTRMAGRCLQLVFYF